MACMSKDGSGAMNVVYGDVTLGAHGPGFDYIFSYSAGGPVSLVRDGREWLYRAPKPTFWRAATDNDRGNGFPFRSAMWMGADLYVKTGKIRVFVDGKQKKDVTAPGNNSCAEAPEARELAVKYTYHTPTVPKTSVDVTYTVSWDGEIRVDVVYHGKEGLPQLPVFGLRFIMPTPASGYEYTGLSGETYPDRMAGGRKGRYQIDGLPVTPYLVPQDCGVHMETQSLVVTRKTVLANEKREEEEFSLKFSMEDGKPFAFSCLPYTALELENASHQEELPLPRRTVVCILGAVRGVGGIDSWGADVEPAYRIDGEKDIHFSFRIGKDK